MGAQHGGLAAKVLALNVLEPYMGASSNPSNPSSPPAPCLWPGKKAIKEGPKLWDPTPAWETQKKFLASDFGSA